MLVSVKSGRLGLVKHHPGLPSTTWAAQSLLFHGAFEVILGHRLSEPEHLPESSQAAQPISTRLSLNQAWLPASMEDLVARNLPEPSRALAACPGTKRGALPNARTLQCLFIHLFLLLSQTLSLNLNPFTKLFFFFYNFLPKQPCPSDNRYGGCRLHCMRYCTDPPPACSLSPQPSSRPGLKSTRLGVLSSTSLGSQECSMRLVHVCRTPGYLLLREGPPRDRARSVVDGGDPAQTEGAL